MEQEQGLNEEWAHQDIKASRAMQCILIGHRELQSMYENKHDVAIIKGYRRVIEHEAREMLVLAQALTEVGNNGQY